MLCPWLYNSSATVLQCLLLLTLNWESKRRQWFTTFWQSFNCFCLTAYYLTKYGGDSLSKCRLAVRPANWQTGSSSWLWSIFLILIPKLQPQVQYCNIASIFQTWQTICNLRILEKTRLKSLSVFKTTQGQTKLTRKKTIGKKLKQQPKQ